jgi:GLPGLI family protein
MAGPSTYWGLPGLIVEVKDKMRHYIATQIKENIPGKIKVPTKGKTISREEFKKLTAESANEWMKDKPKFQVTTY